MSVHDQMQYAMGFVNFVGWVATGAALVAHLLDHRRWQAHEADNHKSTGALH
jgi:uncharacterized membrane protein